VTDLSAVEWLAAVVAAMQADKDLTGAGKLGFTVRDSGLVHLDGVGNDTSNQPLSRMVLAEYAGEDGEGMVGEEPIPASFRVEFLVAVRRPEPTADSYRTARAAVADGVQAVRRILSYPAAGVGGADGFKAEAWPEMTINGVTYAAALVAVTTRHP